MRYAVGLLVGVALLAVAHPGSAQISPSSMRSGVDSVTVPAGGTLVSASRTIFTAPAGSDFVLTDLVCSQDAGFTVLHDVLDNGTALRWTAQSGSSTRWSTGIVFTAGHSVVLRGSSDQPNTPTFIRYCWSGYLVPVASGSVPESQVERLGFALAPNPSKQVVTLRFQLTEPADVALAIYDVQGRQVRLLQSGRAAKGPHSVAWDGRDSEGHAASPGTYFARLASSGAKSVRALVRIH
jgi:hypothetical protein